jgi:hypothetical protein
MDRIIIGSIRTEKDLVRSLRDHFPFAERLIRFLYWHILFGPCRSIIIRDQQCIRVTVQIQGVIEGGQGRNIALRYDRIDLYPTDAEIE